MSAAAALAAFQLVSSIQQAEAIRGQARLQKEIAEFNAQFAELDAYRTEQYGETEVARYQNEIDATVGNQRVAYAASGVDVTSGTAAAIQAETKLTGFLNQLDIRTQAQSKALGYKREAMNIRLQGITGQSQASLNANAVETAGIIGAVPGAISGYGSLRDLVNDGSKKPGGPNGWIK